MDRQNFYSKQLPGPDEFNQQETDVETADGHLVADLGAPGAAILSGLVASQQGSPDMTVHLSAGVAYDGQTPSRRIAVPADVAAIDLSVDSAGAPTHPSAGNYCYVTLAIAFARANSDQRTVDDGTGSGGTEQIYYRQMEGYALVVIKGVDGTISGCTPAALPTGAVLIADYKIANATSSITDQMRDVSRRTPRFSTERSKAPGAALEQLGAALYDNLQVIPQTPYFMGVSVKPGRYNSGSQSFSLGSATPVALTAPGSNSYYALVYADDAGAIGVVYGTASGSPTKPTTQLGLPLAYVLIHSTDTAILESAITDVRPFMGRPGGALYRNRYYLASAAGTEHLLALGFTYAPGTHALDVYVAGEKIPEVDGYTETSATSITLITSPSSGEDVEVYAYQPAVQAVPPAHAGTHAPSGSDPIDYSLVFAPLNGKIIGDCVIATNETIDNGTPTAINVSPLAVVLGGLPLSNPASTSVTSANLESGGSFTATTWLYLYAYRNPDHTASQQLLFTLSTVAPDAANKFKSTDSTRLYIAAVSINARATIRPFHRRGRRTIYHGTYFLDADSTNAFNNCLQILLVAAGPSADSRWMDCSHVVPPTANNIMVGIENRSTSSGLFVGSLNSAASPATLYYYVALPASVDGLVRGEVPSSSQKVGMVTSDYANAYLGVFGYDD